MSKTVVGILCICVLAERFCAAMDTTGQGYSLEMCCLSETNQGKAV